MFQKRNPPIGARPGTLAIPAGSPPPTIRRFSYSKDGCEEGAITDFATLAPPRDGRVTWLDVQGMGDEAALWQIAGAFSIHPLALEDAVNAPQRAKSEVYDGHQLIVARTPMRDAHGDLSLPQVSMVVGDGWVVTCQEQYLGLFDPVRERIRAGTGPIWSQGADYLAYALVDAMIDRYYPIVEELVAVLDGLEEEVIAEPGPEMLPELHRVRGEVALLRRVGLPQQIAVDGLMRDESPFITKDARFYFRDTHDHIAQVVELLDSSRDVARAVMDMYLSHVSHKSNEIMKVLTLMASIFIPLTFMAGLYGMNFQNMPELSKPWAYPVLLGSMAVVAGGMVWWFWRRGWVGRRGISRRRKGRRKDT